MDLGTLINCLLDVVCFFVYDIFSFHSLYINSSLSFIILMQVKINKTASKCVVASKVNGLFSGTV